MSPRNATRRSRLTAVLGLTALLLGINVTSASAAPSLEVKLTSDPLANEIQRLTVRATGGQYRLNFGAGGPGVSQTADISATATAGQVAAALNAIDNISTGGGSVSVTGGPGNALGTNPYDITFGGGPLRITDVPQMTVSAGTTPLTGGSEIAVLRTFQVGGVSLSDARIDYTVNVKNDASANPNAGDELFCNGIETTAGSPKNWNPGAPGDANHPTYSIEWVRNGVLIPGSAGPAPGTGQTYTLVGADEGTVVQCLVTGTNANAAAKYSSLPGVVVGDPPATAPPAATSPTNANSRPVISPTSGAVGVERTCTAPTGWTGALTWSFQWLRNGMPIADANVNATETTSKYTPVLADDGTQIQCQVLGTNGSGSLVGISNHNIVGTLTGNPNLGVAQTPAAESAGNATSGMVTAEVELPAGKETFVFKTDGTGWSCTPHAAAGTDPAKAVCTRSDVLAPQASYPLLTVSIGIGADAPESAQVAATVSGGGAADPASAVDDFVIGPKRPFEITFLETQVLDSSGAEETRAGSHPISAHASFQFSDQRNFNDKVATPGVTAERTPVENVRLLKTHTPRGFVGNALAVPELCPSVIMTLSDPAECPRSSVVGQIRYRAAGVSGNTPIWAIEPEYGLPAQFAFRNESIGAVWTFYPELRADDGYAISLLAAPVAANPPLLGVDATLCSYGARTNAAGTGFTACKQPGELGVAPNTDANPIPLITLPTRCEGDPPVTQLEIDSWQNPGDFKTRDFEAPMPTECEQIRFEPSATVAPTSTQADSPSGLEVELEMPTNGVEGKDDEGNLDPEARSQASMKLSRITFPQGMAINPSAGHGLASCSLAQVKMGTNDPHSCPSASKVGDIEIETPLIRETLSGGVYVGKQSEAPKGSLIGLFLIFESKRDGILIKIPGELKLDPVTGQIVSTFDELVENPFSKARISFPQGPRSSLMTPPRCGTYEIKAEFVPWTIADLDNPAPGEIVEQTTSFDVTSGPGGGPCPSGALQPGFNAGATNPVAGQSSPFVMRLTREDGSDRFTALDVSPPLGMTAHLKGIPYCPDAALASISGAVETGQPQILNPTCPAASLVGRSVAGAGAGPNPLFVDTGRVYLAGPYKGAPLSLAVVTPAVAGPLDLGNVVIRTALHINPETAQITAVSDPIPHILHGVLLNVRDIRVAIDRPGFTLNPTSCEEKVVGARVGGLSGASINLAQRFQVGNCAALGFKPRTNIQLFGGIKRGKYQGVRAVVRPRSGDANISRTVVRFPRSAFVAQENIRTVCTRVQWAADNCPKASIYGRAVAWSPLLDQPLRGNVYLRSSNNLLPDAVADLRGPAHQPIKIEVAIKNDSVKGALRNTVQSAPDAPVSFFRLQMFGGKRGLIVNSRNICQGKNLARANFRAHNGRRSVQNVPVRNARCAKQRKAQKRKAAQRKRMIAAQRSAARH